MDPALLLFVSMLGFVGGHFLLSFPPVRSRLVTRTGEPAFLVLYSILALVFLAGAIWAYGKAPRTPLWDLGAAGRFAPVLVMPVALVLIVLGLFSRNVTAVGGERLVRSGAPIAGIATITRHPFLWGVALWALAHLAANGDLPSLLLFGGMAILALGGMPAIDAKRAARLGEAWSEVARRTSLIPFLAALRGRTSVDWRGIGLMRPVAGIALYALLLATHQTFFGVPALPCAGSQLKSCLQAANAVDLNSVSLRKGPWHPWAALNGNDPATGARLPAKGQESRLRSGMDPPLGRRFRPGGSSPARPGPVPPPPPGPA